MKKKLTLLLSVLMVLITTTFAQNYKKPEDSVKLNKEYISLLEDISEITGDLAEARAKLPELQKNAENRGEDARETAIKSNEQSSKAINGDVDDAKKAKKKANQALNDAKQVENATEKIKDQERKIEKLEKQLQKKQTRIEALDAMRLKISS